MQKYSIKLISKGANQILKNVHDLIQESKILYSNNSFARAFFLTQIAIEELGELSMLIASVQYPKEYKDFWKLFDKLFRDHNFKIAKAEISKQNHNYNFKTNLESSELFKRAEQENQRKMRSLYIDFKGDKIFFPSSEIAFHEAQKKLGEAEEKFKIFKIREDKSFHSEQSLKEIESFYKDPIIREIQDKVFIHRSITPKEYLKLISERSKNMKKSRMSQALKELASYIKI